MQEGHAEVGEDLVLEPLGLLLGRSHLQPVLFVDGRADHEGLAAGRHLPAHQVIGGPTLVSRPGQSGFDRLPSRRELVEHRNVEVAVVRERQRPRDRRRRHDEDVRRDALLLEGDALVNTETVLLVHHGERQVAEGDAFLHQRVGSHHDVHLARPYRLEGRHSFAPGDGRGQQRERGAPIDAHGLIAG